MPPKNRATFTAAVAQAGPTAFDNEATLAHVSALAAEAAVGGAKIVAFPEALFPCYPKGADFGTRVGMRSAEGRSDFRRYYDTALEIGSDTSNRICEIARRNKLIMVIGVIERSGATLYCTALTIDSSGEIIGRHRKVMPTAMERIIWGFGDGSTLSVTPTAVGRVGAVICWENYMPMLRMAMYADGVELYCAPTVDDRDSWVPTMQHIAIEGRCFVLSACQYVTRANYPADYHCVQGNAPETRLIRGGSLIVNPLGRLLAGPLYDRTGVLFAEIDPGEIAEGKFDLDVAGHYSRPDIFQLTVNRRPHAPVGEAPRADVPTADDVLRELAAGAGE